MMGFHRVGWLWNVSDGVVGLGITITDRIALHKKQDIDINPNNIQQTIFSKRTLKKCNSQALD